MPVFRSGRGVKLVLRVFALGFPEFVSTEVIATVEEVFDLENDIGGFAHPLPRMRLF